MKVETQWDEGGGVSGWWWSEGGGTFWRKVAGLMGDDEGEGGGRRVGCLGCESLCLEQYHSRILF